MSKTNLPYGDGSHKIFGMENFGNTCYCNSILQCLYYSETFRVNVVSHEPTPHDRRLVQPGAKQHGFALKYEQLVAKRIKEQGIAAVAADTKRKGSLFGLKFGSTPLNGHTVVEEVERKNWADYVTTAGNCESLLLDQRIMIGKDKEFEVLNVLVTRPEESQPQKETVQSHSVQVQNVQNYAQNVTTQSPQNNNNSTHSTIILGIPNPEPFLTTPINPFNPNPSSDQRKRSALINGPIINLDSTLQKNDQGSKVLLYALKDVFESMIEHQSTIGVVSPAYFISLLKERNYLFRQNNMHHDAHEFLNYLINEIIESLGSTNNWCTELFQGVITNETKCLSCETITSKHEFFLDLPVDIPPGQSAYSLTHALNNFSKLEVLTNQNKFHCNTCSSLQEAVKTIKLAKLPEILVINFKRFKYNEKVDKMVKLFDSISYPFKLRLFNTTDQDDHSDFCLYELYALVVHIGGGPMHGHYVSICKIKAGLWLLFDDETVEVVEDSYVMRFFGDGPGLASAYVLFYQKVECDEEELEFGFNLNDIYNGHEFEYESGESKKEEEDESSTLESSFEAKSSVVSAERKNGIFKKNFKLDKDKGWLKRGEEEVAKPPVERRKSLFGFKRKGT